MSLPSILRPRPLREGDDVSRFRNGAHESLDLWRRGRAVGSAGNAARTYVICPHAAPRRVIGYVSIAIGLEQRIALPEVPQRRRRPDHVPLLLIARLAIDRDFHGLGLGGDLLRDALRRCAAAAESVGARAVVAHAIDEAAVGFYARHGFAPSMLGAGRMVMPMSVVRALVG